MVYEPGIKRTISQAVRLGRLEISPCWHICPASIMIAYRRSAMGADGGEKEYAAVRVQVCESEPQQAAELAFLLTHSVLLRSSFFVLSIM